MNKHELADFIRQEIERGAWPFDTDLRDVNDVGMGLRAAHPERFPCATPRHDELHAALRVVCGEPSYVLELHRKRSHGFGLYVWRNVDYWRAATGAQLRNYWYQHRFDSQDWSMEMAARGVTWLGVTEKLPVVADMAAFHWVHQTLAALPEAIRESVEALARNDTRKRYPNGCSADRHAEALYEWLRTLVGSPWVTWRRESRDA